MQTGNTDFIYKNELDKSCFQHDGYQRGLASMVYRFFDKKSKGSGISALLANKSANEPNYQLVNELHEPIIRKF